MENVSRPRPFSSPDLLPFPSSSAGRPIDSSLEGIATNVRLLLKLIHDHNEGSTKDNDDRKMQRIAGMVTILDDVKLRVQKSHSVGKKSLAELRRCNTDLRPRRCPPTDKKPSQVAIGDEKEQLRKQLNASMAARKSLEIICKSLGKEKGIMASELAKKAHELNEMEELVNDLKVQNETLLAKLQAHVAEQKKKKISEGEAQGNAALQQRNRALSEQLLKSLDDYRSLKRKYKVEKEKNIGICNTMDVIGVEVASGLERIRGSKNILAISKDNNNIPEDLDREISELEQMFERFDLKISNHEENLECIRPKAKIEIHA